jgi:hypothetical protein
MLHARAITCSIVHVSKYNFECNTLHTHKNKNTQFVLTGRKHQNKQKQFPILNVFLSIVPTDCTETKTNSNMIQFSFVVLIETKLNLNLSRVWKMDKYYELLSYFDRINTLPVVKLAIVGKYTGKNDIYNAWQNKTDRERTAVSTKVQ